MLLSLLDRRVPQVVGVYLAASWGCVEFCDFAVGQFANDIWSEADPEFIAAQEARGLLEKLRGS